MNPRYSKGFTCVYGKKAILFVTNHEGQSKHMLSMTLLIYCQAFDFEVNEEWSVPVPCRQNRPLPSLPHRKRNEGEPRASEVSYLTSTNPNIQRGQWNSIRKLYILDLDLIGLKSTSIARPPAYITERHLSWPKNIRAGVGSRKAAWEQKVGSSVNVSASDKNMPPPFASGKTIQARNNFPKENESGTKQRHFKVAVSTCVHGSLAKMAARHVWWHGATISHWLASSLRAQKEVFLSVDRHCNRHSRGKCLLV